MYQNDLIKGAMAAKDLKVEDVAASAKVSRPTVTAIRLGRDNVTLRSLKKVANATGFEIEIRLIPAATA